MKKSKLNPADVEKLKIWEHCGDDTIRVRRVPGGLVITEKEVFTTETNHRSGNTYAHVASCSSVFIPDDKEPEPGDRIQIHGNPKIQVDPIS